MKSFNERLIQLKNYEIQCYRICFYLLNSEQLATKASEQTLIHLLYDRGFFLLDELEQGAYVKQVSMKFALEAYATSR